MQAPSSLKTCAPIWPQWQQVTRLLFSGQIAFDAEISRWEATEIDVQHGVRLKDKSRGSNYRVTLDQHLSTIRERSAFYGVIVVQAHALMEGHAKYIRHCLDSGDYNLIYRNPNDHEIETILDIELSGGIEVWGGKLLYDMGRDWQIVDGKAGLVTTSIVRNAIAHGYPRLGAEMKRKAEARGVVLTKLARI